ncbi:hypothetical protein PR003_g15286 [Phytophthora rubi]|uniref:Uncharacterized protein n=1 Tax=Phytophthora rubi TaxID=129364 RepID=A0A6A4EZ09_9STRA|nr:hypothetical protein PR002_g19443 [Phytophthora rubi]KAE9001971.1 hypothetical protein PR001_g18380 [Phytophthora rubi]KAE9330490.1 hypothetical protein PR003_g15286 [Phytophthora rubi]
MLCSGRSRTVLKRPSGLGVVALQAHVRIALAARDTKVAERQVRSTAQHEGRLCLGCYISFSIRKIEGCSVGLTKVTGACI